MKNSFYGGIFDDELENPEAFIQWRDYAMGASDYWFIQYHYASDSAGNPIVTFARERVLKRKKGYKWSFFIHEGIVPQAGDGTETKINAVNTWAIKHLRTLEDMARDKGRNLKIFEEKMKEGPLCSRMQFYYGKELFDNERFQEASSVLTRASALTDAQPHDRILSIQYAALSLLRTGKPLVALEVCQQGLLLDPNRAEFYCSMGDAYASMGNFRAAIPNYHAAINCTPIDTKAGLSPIYSQKNCYGEYPFLQLAKIHFHLGDLARAESFAHTVIQVSENEEAKQLLMHIQKIKPNFSISVKTKKCDDIVFSCPPAQAYQFNPDIMREKGVGGSETALIHMAKWIKKHSNRPVKVFTQAEGVKFYDDVEYIPSTQIMEYMKSFEPHTHIAWRHNIKITNAKTYLWSHDLITPGINQFDKYDKLLCLSEFHKNYASAMQGVPLDKIHVTRNGIDPTRFLNRGTVNKIAGKVIWSSSPDRGLDRAIRIFKGLKKDFPEINMHVFYGTDNLRKFGQVERADYLDNLIKENSDFITYHGNVQQDVLAKHQMESVVTPYVCDFIETFCLTVCEAACAGSHVVTRNIGALKDTMTWANAMHCATFLEENCETPEEYSKWSNAIASALSDKKWEGNWIDPNTISWERIALEWLHDLIG